MHSNHMAVIGWEYFCFTGCCSAITYYMLHPAPTENLQPVLGHHTNVYSLFELISESSWFYGSNMVLLIDDHHIQYCDMLSLRCVY